MSDLKCPNCGSIKFMVFDELDNGVLVLGCDYCPWEGTSDELVE